MTLMADAPARMQPEDLLKLSVLNNKGQNVMLSAFVVRLVAGIPKTTRYSQK